MTALVLCASCRAVVPALAMANPAYAPPVAFCGDGCLHDYLRTRLTAERNQRQQRTAEWIVRAFGDATVALPERVARFFEEAVELAQACQVGSGTLVRIIDHVWSKEAGEPAQEIGGVGVTLLALAATLGVSADEAERVELERVEGIDVAHFRERHNRKADAGIALRAPAPERREIPLSPADALDGMDRVRGEGAYKQPAPDATGGLGIDTATAERALAKGSTRCTRPGCGKTKAQHIESPAGRLYCWQGHELYPTWAGPNAGLTLTLQARRSDDQYTPAPVPSGLMPSTLAAGRTDMAHLRSIVTQCARCPRTAVVELLNRGNGRMGSYCQRCGDKALGEEKKREQREDVAQAEARERNPRL